MWLTLSEDPALNIKMQAQISSPSTKAAWKATEAKKSPVWIKIIFLWEGETNIHAEIEALWRGGNSAVDCSSSFLLKKEIST